DYIGSTSGIINYAKESNKKEFIIGTENSICEFLQYECPDKRFYPLSKDLVCHNMKISTLPELLLACKGEFGEEIHIDEEIRKKAIKSIDNMLKYGG
ncbi:MAG: quinolinate synthase NadA, partial [Eubacterium sp.]|nr:quinolinate synthase NadA [Eubacterium sp.]